MCTNSKPSARLDCLIDRIADRIIERILECDDHRPTTLKFKLGPVSERTTMPLKTMLATAAALVLTDTQQILLSIDPKTRAGNPANVENVVWGSSDPNVITITPATDGLSATAATTGTLGTVQITVTADADLGAGVEEITGVQEIQVLAGKAVSLGITGGSVTERPEDPS